MKNLIITQARIGSSRLPGKVLKTIDEIPLLEIHLHRLKRSTLADAIMVATTFETQSEEILKIAKKMGCLFYQGSTDDVLDRFYQAASIHQPKNVIRVTSDCPLNDGVLIDEMLREFDSGKFDYFSNVNPPTFPNGVDVEIFSFEALKDAWLNASDKNDREHVTPYLRNHIEKFKNGNFIDREDNSGYRITVDRADDFELIKRLVQSNGPDKSWREYLDYLKANPELLKINQNNVRNEGY